MKITHAFPNSAEPHYAGTSDRAGHWYFGDNDVEAADTPPARPLIDFSGSSRATARAYAKVLQHDTLSEEVTDLLRGVAEGEKVDAYDLNEAVLSAMRSCANRGRNAHQRRALATMAAHLGHIIQAVLENHADNLPAYAEGQRSRKIAALEHEFEAARARITELELGLARQFETAKAEFARAERLQRIHNYAMDLHDDEEIARVSGYIDGIDA